MNEEKEIKVEKGKKKKEKSEDKKAKGNNIAMIICFVILLAFIIALPYLDGIINLIRNSDVHEIINPDDNDKKDDEDNQNNESATYNLITARFTFNNLEFSNFGLRFVEEDYKISFNIANRGSEPISLLNSSYFLEIYTEDNTLIERVKIEQNMLISPNDSRDLEFYITESSYRNGKNIRITNKTLDDYPNISLRNVENEYILVCTNRNNRITYFFEEEQLIKLEDVWVYENINENYATIVTNRLTEINNLNNQNGITASLIQNSGNFFTTTIIVDLEEAANLGNRHYFRRNALARLVSFEMQAMRFVCN